MPVGHTASSEKVEANRDMKITLVLHSRVVGFVCILYRIIIRVSRVYIEANEKRIYFHR